jgi:tRNA dimethylallyltransferase
VALELGELLRSAGEDPVAVSADALQVYEGLELLTGAATPDEQARLEHRLISFVPIEDTFSVGQFMPLAHAEIDGALAGGLTPIVVGGTGLYLRAALAELDLAPQPPAELRSGWEKEAERRGVRALHAELALRAPAVAAGVEPSDRTRVIRALELSDMDALDEQRQRGDGDAEESQLWSPDMRHPTVLVGLVADRHWLYERIERRVDAMVGAGVVEEARRADAAGASRTARKALGFEDLLTGDVDAMKRRSRNYAKRQLTWIRKMAGIHLIDVTGRAPTEVAAEVFALAGRT